MNNQIIKNPLQNISQMQSLIASNGIAFFEEDFNQEQFIEFGKKFGEIYLHRDSITNGITVVKSVINKENVDSGFYGLTSSSLFPHTDRSSLDEPPNILALYCKNQSGEGGESTLVDIKDVIEEMSKHSDIENHPIFEMNSAIFDDGKTSHKGSIIEKVKDGSYYLRFRNDEFGYFNSKIFPSIKMFQETVLNKKVTVKLNDGQGFIINNGRFLHGRNEFNGNREMWRLLLSDNFMQHKGFNLKNIYEYN